MVGTSYTITADNLCRFRDTPIIIFGADVM